MSTLDSACWSGNDLNALHGVLQPSDSRLSSHSSGKSSHDVESLLFPDELDLLDALEDEQQQTFSPIGASAGARLYLIQTPRGAGAAPPTVIWATPGLAWGNWPCYTFSHCISVMAERDARAAYEFESGQDDSDSENESPLPPRRSARKVNGLTQLSEEQMRAAMAFFRRTTVASTGSAGITGMTVDDVAADRNSQEGDDAGFHADDPGVAAPVLVSCTYGNEVDAVAVAVLLLAQHVKIRRHASGRGCRTFGRDW